MIVNMGSNMMDCYRVCWKCRGLFPFNRSTDKSIDDHMRDCREMSDSKSVSFQEKHYVCDMLDFYALKHLKAFLRTNVGLILSAKKGLLALGFPIEFIESLLVFCQCQVRIEKNIFCNQHNDSDREDHTFCTNSAQESNVTLGLSVESEAKNIYKEMVVVQDGSVELLKEEEKDVLTKQCKLAQQGNIQEFECKLCSYRNKSSKLMLKHLNAHGSNGQGFNCAHCKFSTTLRCKWNRHRCKNEKVSLLCKDCGETLKSKAELNHHVVTKHTSGGRRNRAKFFKCDKCLYVGRDMRSLADHQRKHTGDYLPCSVAGCTFKTFYKRALQQHLQQKHATEKGQVCHVCGFQTNHVSSLRKHMRLHEQTKQHKCTHCSFSSYDSSTLILHTRRKHLKEQNYLCSECPFKTGYAVALKKHMEKHEQSRKDQAEGIQSKSKRKTRIKLYNCYLCSETFATMAKMKKHSRLCQQPPLQLQPLNTCTSNDTIGEVFDENAIFYDPQMEDDVSAEVFSITNNNMLDAETPEKSFYTVIVENQVESTVINQEGFCQKEPENVTCEERNPMLASRTLAAERSSPLLEESLFNLMLDFPKPPSLNRCQSASTLMFASLSPHLVDRPLTPDFLSDNPASSFFQSLSRHLEHDNLTVGSLN